MFKEHELEFEFAGKTKDVTDVNEFSDEIKLGIMEYFNHLSINKL
jgi:uncharacterized protein YkvS